MADSLAALKSSVYAVQVGLLEGIPSNAHLQAASKVLTQSEYADVVTERTIANLCGYPLCERPLPESFPHKGRYHISLREHKVYDVQETRFFCSSECLVSSQSFATSLALDRDHTEKTIELAAAFLKLNFGNVDHQQTSSLATRIGGDRPAHTQEHDILSHHQTRITTTTCMPACNEELDLPMVDVKAMAIEQPQQLDPGSSFSIHEQKEIKVDDFSCAGPPDAIEGYIPQRGFRQTRHYKVSGQEDDKAMFFSRHKSNSLLKEESLRQTARQRHSKKKNRVSWADHNNLKLVEEASSSCIPSSSGTSEDSRDARVSQIKENDQDNMSASLPSEIGAVVVEESSEVLPSLKSIRSEEVHDDLECVKALVEALAEAAEAAAHGEADSSEAVARAGISILSKDEVPPNQVFDFFKEELKDSAKELVDEESADPKDSWYSAPPKEFKPELSTFGALWMALDGWISAASIAHVYGRDLNEGTDFAFINGKEYLSQMMIPNGVSAEIERTLSGCISRALPGLAETLRLPIPVSTLEQSLGRFLRTMSFVKAIPPFSSKQWQVVVLLLLDALSVHRLPALRTRFLNGRQLLQKVLDSSHITEAEYEVFRDLVLPMGVLPEFAAHCGG